MFSYNFSMSRSVCAKQGLEAAVLLGQGDMAVFPSGGEMALAIKKTVGSSKCK